MKSIHPETAAIHYRIDNAETSPVATPIYQNSAFTADSPYFYTRKSNPNSSELEGALALLERSRHVISTTTGMSAIMLVLQLLRPGDHLVVNHTIYGCSYKLFQRYADRLGLKLTIMDLSDVSQRRQIPADVNMLFFETPTNPFLKQIPIRETAEIVAAKNPAALIVVDNTWATPLFQNPLECGATAASCADAPRPPRPRETDACPPFPGCCWLQLSWSRCRREVSAFSLQIWLETWVKQVLGVLGTSVPPGSAPGSSRPFGSGPHASLAG